MARKGSQYLELSGPLFDDDAIEKFKDAVAWGIEELADEADDIMGSFIMQGGFVDTGRLLRSVDADFIRTGGQIGYAKVLPTDVWPEPDRPTRTWIARGVRGGVKLRKQFDIFSRTATRVRSLDQSFIATKISTVLNG